MTKPIKDLGTTISDLIKKTEMLQKEIFELKGFRNMPKITPNFDGTTNFKVKATPEAEDFIHRVYTAEELKEIKEKQNDNRS